MPTAGRRVTPALVAVLVLCGCSAGDGDDPSADTSGVTESPGPTAEPTHAAPAPPDPAPPDPAPPDPAPPDPAPPDPAPPAPDPGAVTAAQVEQSAEAAASVSESPMAAACAEVVAAMTEAVMSYETVAMAEGGGGGDREAAAAEMRAAWQQAKAAADGMGAGLPSAAAPALTALTALHDGLGTREVLDASDADQWREAREALQSWCRANE